MNVMIRHLAAAAVLALIAAAPQATPAESPGTPEARA